MGRFSDEELVELRKEVQELKSDFDNVVPALGKKLEDHIADEVVYREENDLLMQKFALGQEANTAALKEQSATLQRQIESTQGVVSLFEDVAAGGRVLDRLGKLEKPLKRIFLWIAGITVWVVTVWKMFFDSPGG